MLFSEVNRVFINHMVAEKSCFTEHKITIKLKLNIFDVLKLLEFITQITVHHF